MEINCKFCLYICWDCCQRSIIKVWQSICGNVRFTCRCHRNSEQRIRTKYRLSLLHIQLYQWWVPARFMKSCTCHTAENMNTITKRPDCLNTCTCIFLALGSEWHTYFLISKKTIVVQTEKKSVQMIWCNNMKKLLALTKL